MKDKLRMMGSRSSMIAPVVFFTVLMLFGCNAFATFGLGNSILQSDTILFDGPAVIINSQSYSRSGHVDYEIYAPGEYSGTLSSISQDHYVYAYQVFNDSASTLSINTVVINLLPDVIVGLVGYEGSGVDPSGNNSPSISGNVTFEFYTAQIIAGANSSVLIFSSETEPTLGFGSLNGGVIGTILTDVPTPTIPEPVSILLFGMSGAYVAFSRRRKAS